ncbi:MAG: hypothetical protein QW318_07950 [Candidatus Caldarchaeum sp.]
MTLAQGGNKFSSIMAALDLPPLGEPAEMAGMASPGPELTNEEMVSEVDQMAANPQFMQAIQASIMQLLQSGQVSPQDLKIMGELTKAVVSNPAIYPKVRQFAVQKGLASEQDLPQEYDPAIAAVMYAISKAIDTMDLSAAEMPQAPQKMAYGGVVSGGGTGQRGGEVPVIAHEGEYVVPAEVVRAKGTEFFDRLSQKYRLGTKNN